MSNAYKQSDFWTKSMVHIMRDRNHHGEESVNAEGNSYGILINESLLKLLFLQYEHWNSELHTYHWNSFLTSEFLLHFSTNLDGYWFTSIFLTKTLLSLKSALLVTIKELISMRKLRYFLFSFSNSFTVHLTEHLNFYGSLSYFCVLFNLIIDLNWVFSILWVT